MSKGSKEPKNDKYSTIIASKEDIIRISKARDAWKLEQKNFSEIGITKFMIFLLEFYENQKKKEKSNEETI